MIALVRTTSGVQERIHAGNQEATLVHGYRERSGEDGTRKEKEEDFEVVRGAFEQNPFVAAVKEHISTKRALGDELIGRIEKLIQ